MNVSQHDAAFQQNVSDLKQKNNIRQNNNNSTHTRAHTHTHTYTHTHDRKKKKRNEETQRGKWGDLVSD